MYHSVLSHEEQKNLRRILWRPTEVWGTSFKENPPDVFRFLTIQFGDRPAGCAATTALKQTAEKYGEDEPEAKKAIIDDSYVDDIITGAENTVAAEEKIKAIKKIAEPGGFIFKKFTVTGQADDNEGTTELFQTEDTRVLGVAWEPVGDMLVYKAKINPYEKKRGKKIGPDLRPSDICGLSGEDLTRRRLLRVVNSLFDPLGLLAPFSVKLKISMKSVRGLGWDEPLPADVAEVWVKTLQSLAKLDTKFRRSIHPGICPYTSVSLCGFCDGSLEAFAAVIYTRVEEAGLFKTYILTAKSRVTPVYKISVPRIELLASLLLSRLMNSAVKAISNLNIDKIFNFVDSTSTLGMLNKQSTALHEFAGTRVGEIRRTTDALSNKKRTCAWLWCPREFNVADIPSKGSLDNSVLESDLWRHGPEFITQREETWPTKSGKDFTAPKEEVRISTTCLLSTELSTADKSESFLMPMARKCSSLTKLIGTTAWIFRLVKNRLKKKGPLDKEDLMVATKFWEEDAMVSSRIKFKNGDYSALRAYQDQDGTILCAGRIPSQSMKVGYDKIELPILPANHVYSKLFIKDRHTELGHSGIDKTVDLTRAKYWIPHCRRVASSVWKNCFKCKLVDKHLQEQLMSKYKLWRTLPSPVFSTVCLDLFGPVYIKDNVVKRSGRGSVQSKAWGVVFVCAATGCLSLDLTEDYSTDSMLQCLRRFTCEHGQPSTFITDRGSQLTASQKEVLPDWEKIEERMSEVQWIFSPTEGHHYNGLAEIMVKKTKRSLEFILDGEEKLTFGQLQTFLKECKAIINSRPLGPKSCDDPSSSPPLTPNHLLLAGRPTIEIPQGDFQETKLNKRFIYIQNLIAEWWKKWFSSVFPSLLPSYKWATTRRNLMSGDVVLIHKENIKRGTYLRGIVIKPIQSDDGLVRKAVIQYIIGGVKKTVERAVSSLVLIVPAGYTQDEEL